MRIKVNFGNNSKPISKPLNKEVNGFLNAVLGEKNKYHGSFSRYSISSMQGGVMDKDGTLNFPNGGFVFISSDDYDFIANVLKGLSTKQEELHVLDMKYKNMEISDFIVNDKFDLVRSISPIFITIKRTPITFKDSGFVDILTKKSVEKLIKCGYDEKLANTIKIKLFHPENAATKVVEIGKAKNLANKVMLYVEGDKTMRKALYEIGLGKSTGFGFGAVNINNKNFL